ncbi:hypothetical protein [Novosphingobium percolationis]|uniref:hypothetical protein n=1 Tax=Novosphingobium percolationis TaxID=2871811 RepID=UPI001CD72DA5|nr:hypothetical protein [Novosphingobium percolationis]
MRSSSTISISAGPANDLRLARHDRHHATRLWTGRVRDTRIDMTASSVRLRASVRACARMRLFALSAILAMFGMLALATWHDAMPHVHDVGHVVSVDRDHHDHVPAEQPDTPDLMHLAAHAVLQTIDVPAQAMVESLLKPVAAIWARAPAEAARSIAPSSILRPPRG